MSALSNYLEDALINLVLRNIPYTSPGTGIYVAVFTGDPLEDASGPEVSGNGYARVQVTAWDAPSNGVTQNTGAISFPAASGGAWGTITYAAIFDALTVGNMLFYGPLSASKVVNDTEQLIFQAGQFAVDLA